MTKQLFIIYDKEYKACAELLYNLLSQHTNIKASMYTQKEIGKLVSREKCLYIGTGCSSNLQFEDLYEELGIHVGYMGAKAWVKCSSYEWNPSKFKKFEKILEDFTKRYKTKEIFDIYKKYNKRAIFRSFQIGEEPWPGNPWNRITDKHIANKGIQRVLDIYCATGYLWGFIPVFKTLLRLTGEEPAIRFYQYYIGAFTFYEKYLNDFLEISESDDTDINQEESLENEKKKKK